MDYIEVHLIGTKRITEYGVVAVAVISITDGTGSSRRSSADYGLRDYVFVRIADCVRIGRRYGFRDYRLF